MYYFLPKNPAEPLILTRNEQICGQICQYLKRHQIEAIKFAHAQLSKGLCILNDESGLGKVVVVASLLGAVLGQNKKKCLVIVSDEYLNGWLFHLNIFSDLSCGELADKDSNSTLHNVILAKWNTLRLFTDLKKMKFDYVIVDNRGGMLTNSFCTSMLLRHFESKVNIVVSSSDVTADLKLLHNILRLGIGGRVDSRLATFEAFERKFKLPVISKNKADLEDYFQKRQVLVDYCRDFRLRRYKYQYEQILPLVDVDIYKNNLLAWQSNAEKLSDSQKSSDTQISESSDELLTRLNKIKAEFGLNSKINSIHVISEPIVIEDEDLSCDKPMSPLFFVSDSEEEIQNYLKKPTSESISNTISIAGENIEIDLIEKCVKTDVLNKDSAVDNEKKLETKDNENDNVEIVQIEECVKTDVLNKDSSAVDKKDNRDDLNSIKNNKMTKRTRARKNINETTIKQEPVNTRTRNKNVVSSNTTSSARKRCIPKGKAEKPKVTDSEEIKSKKIDKSKPMKTSIERKIKKSQRNQLKSIDETSSQKSAVKSKCISNELEKNTIHSHAKKSREGITDLTTKRRNSCKKIVCSDEIRQTRGMQRLTRSAGKKSKYLKNIVAWDIEKTPSKRLKQKTVKKNIKTSKTTRTESVLCSSDYEDMIECGQKLSYSTIKSSSEKAPNENFILPSPAIKSTASSLLQSLNTDSDFAIVDSPLASDVIMISSSESQQSLMNCHRRTKALKNKQRKEPKDAMKTERITRKSLVDHKSPDLFSGSCTQRIEGFQIFSISGNSTNTKNKSLEILEKMFETQRTDLSSKPDGKSLDKSVRVNEDEIFEITSNGTFGSLLRLHSNGDISPLASQIRTSVQNNKITNYLINSKDRLSPAQVIESGLEPKEHTPTKRTAQLLSGTSASAARISKSPKYSKPSMQKLTKWFRSNQGLNNESGDDDNQVSTSRQLKSKGRPAVKRRRLDLSFRK